MWGNVFIISSLVRFCVNRIVVHDLIVVVQHETIYLKEIIFIIKNSSLKIIVIKSGPK